MSAYENSRQFVLGEAINRLAAYEDTGLTPEEVAALASAKAEGRLVVLPCKVGDTLYHIGRGKVEESRVGHISTEYTMDSETGIGGVWWTHDYSFGETIFLTRPAAAGRACKGGGDVRRGTNCLFDTGSVHCPLDARSCRGCAWDRAEDVRRRRLPLVPDPETKLHHKKIGGRTE